MHKKKIKIMVIAVFAPVFALLIYCFLPIDAKKLKGEDFISTKIYDRNNILLMEVNSDRNGVSEWVKTPDVSKHFMNALISAEDKNFYKHFGIDFSASARAFKDLIKHRRVVSGASTLTQQLARIIYEIPRKKITKPLVVTEAVRLEFRLTKEEILNAFLNRVCFGNQVFGISSASGLYFGKSPANLSIAESAFIAGMIQSPTRYNPYRYFEKTKKRQKYVLSRMRENGYIKDREYELAVKEKIKLKPPGRSFKAPHFCYFVLNELKKGHKKKFSEIHTTLDYYLQKEMEKKIKIKIDSLKDKNMTNCSALVLENETGAILAMIGSKDFFDFRIDGQVNGCLAVRQPGSTIKPFTYALALERGFKASDIIEDVPATNIAVDTKFIPRNYDNKFHGPVRLRTALACSYNVPAVRVLEKLGEDYLLSRLRDAGFSSLNKPSENYRLGLTLGDGDVTLLELVRAYSVFSRGGKYKKEYFAVWAKDQDGKTAVFSPDKTDKKIFSEQVSYIITDILSENSERNPAFGSHSALNFPFSCASKTGTSTLNRDNWTAGYTPEYSAGVWAGNFDGSPMQGVSGITGAAPIYRDIMMTLNKNKTERKFSVPSSLVRMEICPGSGLLKSDDCPCGICEVFECTNVPMKRCGMHKKNSDVYSKKYMDMVEENSIDGSKVKYEDGGTKDLRITYPANEDKFMIDPSLDKIFQKIRVKADVPGDVKEVIWQVNDKVIAKTTDSNFIWWDMEKGEHSIKVKGRTAEGAERSSSLVRILIE